MTQLRVPNLGAQLRSYFWANCVIFRQILLLLLYGFISLHILRLIKFILEIFRIAGSNLRCTDYQTSTDLMCVVH